MQEAANGAALVSIQWVNNETGTIQPLREVAEAAANGGDGPVPVHSDAAQAIAHLSVDFSASGLTTMAVSAHKLGGPVGVGALIARRDAKLTPLTHGGGQERRARSGTVDVAGVRAFAAALEETVRGRDRERARLEALRARLVAGVQTAAPEARVSGPDDPKERAPHIVHLVIPGAPSEAMLFLLDQHGIAASSGSACTAGVVDASHVAMAMGWSAVEASQTLRLSLGHTSTDADVEAVLAALPQVVEKARATLR
jgi:cysteine desulfurase